MLAIFKFRRFFIDGLLVMFDRRSRAEEHVLHRDSFCLDKVTSKDVIL